ncbi:hypothetical protein STSO111631_19130 [Stackebrandtia soli]
MATARDVFPVDGRPVTVDSGFLVGAAILLPWLERRPETLKPR